MKLSYLAKHDRQTIIILILVVVVALLLFFLAGGRDSSGNKEEDNDNKAEENFYGDSHDGVSADSKAKPFPFDPNSADSATLVKLGLSSRVAHNICRYRAKGGTFQRPEDFARIYGLTAGEYRRLAPYIRIAEDMRPASEVYGNYERGEYGDAGTSSHGYVHEYPVNATAADSMAHPVKIKSGETLNASIADTTQLCRIPGIGQYFARQIFRYRERLGGFVNRDQLLEIDGFPESALPFITIDATKIRRLKVNSATAEQLRTHPYIDLRQARDIIKFRRQYGRINDINDLRATRAFGDKALKAIAPYIEY